MQRGLEQSVSVSHRRLVGENMAISKRAKARMKTLKRTELANIKRAAFLLYQNELMGIKRMREITRWTEKTR